MEVSASRTRQRQVQRLFAEVVGLDENERAARLDRACEDDPSLRDEVGALLHRRAGGSGAPFRSAPGQSLVLGEIVGHYCLLEELGRGAMGIVYRAEDTRLKRSVALKFLAPGLGADNKARARLEREAQAASALDHPNICTVYEIGETDDGRLFLALACYDGETLENRIERGPLDVDEAVRIAVRMARGLAAAHRHGIVHRDVKPSNVLITHTDGSSAGQAGVKLLDFGIARVAGSDLTGSGDTLGTAAYMAPEQLRGEPDARSDLWALGVTLYEMLTGTRPFQGDYEAALLYAVLNEDPAPLPKTVPEELREIVERCLEKDPELRYQSAEEVEVALEHLRVGDVTGGSTRRVSRRTRRIALGLGTLAVLLVLLVSPLRTVIPDALSIGSPDVQHLAVLPFVGSAEEASVAEGLMLTLTSLLTGLGSHAERPITVVPSSEMREITTAAEARERYGVDFVVTGNFRQGEREVRLTLNLVDARSLRQLQSETISEPADRLPLLQRRAIIKMAEMLGVSLSGEQQAMLSAGTTDARAYEFYLKGEAELERFDKEENLDAALRLFELALREDSNYALAHAGLCETQMRKYGSSQAAEWVELAEQHCNHALALNDMLAPVHITLGDLHALTGDHEAAAGRYRLALALDSTEAEAYHGLGEAYSKMQRPIEAESSFRTAVQLRPNDWRYPNAFGAFLLANSRLDEAATQFQRSIELAPDNDRPYSNMGVLYASKGDYIQATRWFEQAIEIKPTGKNYTNLAIVYYVSGDFREEMKTYRRALKLDSNSYTTWGNLGDAYARLDRDIEATAAYTQAANLLRAALKVNPTDVELLAGLADYATSLGELQEALLCLDRIPLDAQGDYFLPRRIAGLYARLQRRNEAFEWIEEAQKRGLTLEELEENGYIGDLRNDPRYGRN